MFDSRYLMGQFKGELPTAVIFNPECEKHSVGPTHPEGPERLFLPLKALYDSHNDDINFYIASRANSRDLKRAHTDEQLEKLKAKSPKKGYAKLDDDTKMNPASWVAALNAAGAQINAVDLVMSGKVKGAFCHVRPPGHHAGAESTGGFCLLSNVAIGALYAAHKYDLKVAVFDIDAHHGNGTEEIFANSEYSKNLLLFSAYQKGIFPDPQKPDKQKNTIHTPLRKHASGQTLRRKITEEWLPQIDLFKPDLIYISAGFDAHENERDDIAQLKLNDDDFEWLAQKAAEVANSYCKGRLVSSLEGGYNLEILPNLIVNHVKTLNKHLTIDEEHKPTKRSRVALPKKIRDLDKEYLSKSTVPKLMLEKQKKQEKKSKPKRNNRKRNMR